MYEIRPAWQLSNISLAIASSFAALPFRLVMGRCGIFCGKRWQVLPERQVDLSRFTRQKCGWKLRHLPREPVHSSSWSLRVRTSRAKKAKKANLPRGNDRESATKSRGQDQLRISPVRFHFFCDCFCARTAGPLMWPTSANFTSEDRVAAFFYSLSHSLLVLNSIHSR